MLALVVLAIPMRGTDAAIERARHQRPALLVRVLEAASGRALPNAEVGSLDDGRRQLTSSIGEARVEWPASRTLRLRVRQIGFRFAERTLRAREDGSTDSAVFALERVPIVLPELRATALQPCETNADPEAARLSLVALEQLQLAAQHYRQFEEAYPFEARLERRTAYLNEQGSTRRLSILDERAPSGKFGEQYEQGRVLNRRGRAFDAKLLFIVALADTTFWEAHCLTVRGVEERDGRRFIRLDFAPVADIKSPDWAGTAWLDSASSVMRRLDFRLTGLEESDNPGRLEGYTTFVEPSAFITFPDSNVAYWWMKRPSPDSGWGSPSVLQLLRVKEVRYKKTRPP